MCVSAVDGLELVHVSMYVSVCNEMMWFYKECTFNYMIPKLMLNNVAAAIEDWNDNNKNLYIYNDEEDDVGLLVGWLLADVDADGPDGGGLEISFSFRWNVHKHNPSDIHEQIS